MGGWQCSAHLAVRALTDAHEARLLFVERGTRSAPAAQPAAPAQATQLCMRHGRIRALRAWDPQLLAWSWSAPPVAAASNVKPSFATWAANWPGASCASSSTPTSLHATHDRHRCWTGVGQGPTPRGGHQCPWPATHWTDQPWRSICAHMRPVTARGRRRLGSLAPGALPSLQGPGGAGQTGTASRAGLCACLVPVAAPA